MNTLSRSWITMSLLVPLMYGGLNVASYVSERYVPKFMDKIIVGKEYSCGESLDTIHNLDTPTGHVLFPLAIKGAEDYYEANCR